MRLLTYTGREADGLGIDYYRARYYNPAIGRFISEDPMGFAGSGTNFYAYVGGDPIDFNDPSGMDKKNPFQCGAKNAEKVSLASLTGLGDAGGVTGFAANALGGNAFSGLTDLGTSLFTGSGGGHSVFYNMGQGIVAGPTQGFGPAFGRSIEGTPWASGPADAVTNAILGGAFNQITGAGEGIQSINGFTSIASTTLEDGAVAAESAAEAAEFASGIGEAKLGYDALTYFGAAALCEAGYLQ